MICGIDTSKDAGAGKSRKTGRTYIGLVIGTDEVISKINESFGPDMTHMRSVRRRKRQAEIVSRLKFDPKDSMAICIEIDKRSIVYRTSSRLKKKRKRRRKVETNKLYASCDVALYRIIKRKINKFILEHNCDLGEIEFQYDKDCEDFVKHNNLRGHYRGPAYRISDILAWANLRGMEPDGATHINAEPEVEDEVRRMFLK